MADSPSQVQDNHIEKLDSDSKLGAREAGFDEEKQLGVFLKMSHFLLRWGVETHGITPIPTERRVDKRIYQMFFIWFSVNFNILAFGTGSAGPAFFSLGVRDSLMIILVVNVITCTIPAYFAVFGPKLGTRGMVQCRFSWGYYAAAIPSALNVLSSQGFLVLNCIIGGQALAAVSDKLDDTLGIVIIGVVSLVVTFCGYRFLHWLSFVWIPNVVALPILLGLAGKHLNPSTFPSVPAASAGAILSFGSFVASSVISWCTFTPDYGVYHDTKASVTKIFFNVYFGFLIPSITWHMVGAAFASAAPGIPSWSTGFQEGNSVGGLLSAVLAPAGGFGKFVLVLIALSTSSACAPTMYTFGNSFMAIAPFFARVPRYVFTVVSEAILIPVAIIGAKRFYTTLVDILSIIGYWSTVFAAIVLTEHFIFRRNNFDYYFIEQWDQPQKLPLGVAALLAFFGAFGIIVPSMSQTWYTGPIARAGSGDIGVLTGAVAGVLLYAMLRAVEKRTFPTRS
ncbi:cytosine-purine permease [Crassisporium funariophilum]|nr:cytosine-purine permease [Crassisporium funariophilum]